MTLTLHSAFLALSLLAFAAPSSAFTPPLLLSQKHPSLLRVSTCPTAQLRARPQQRRASVASTFLSRVRAVDGKVVDDVAVVLLAGGVGSRMKAGMPKQFLELQGKPMLMHSLELFLRLKGVKSITIVIAEEYRDMFDALVKKDKRINFASPGKERQDSVFNGFQQTPKVKESEDGKFVLRTIERSRLWEIHTPQVIRPALLKKGFEKVQAEQLAVTDDVSIIEQLPAPVKITLGEYTNIKVTTPEDMPMATSILDSRK